MEVKTKKRTGKSACATQSWIGQKILGVNKQARA